MIKQGDTELFSIDPKTGVIKTVRGLDYESQSQHVLIIGIEENTSDLPGSTTRVVVNVQVFPVENQFATVATVEFRYSFVLCTALIDWRARGYIYRNHEEQLTISNLAVGFSFTAHQQ